jgi:hypothetical protein
VVAARRRLIRPRNPNKPDLRPIDDAPVQAAVTGLFEARRRKKGVVEAEKELVRRCEIAQQHRDRRVRQDALWLLSNNLPPGGERIAFKAIRDDVHESCVFAGMHCAYEYVRKYGVRLDSGTVEAVRALALDEQGQDTIRWFAVHLLGRAAGKGAKAALIDISKNGPSEKTRDEAYQALVKYGYPPAKRKILTDLRSGRDDANAMLYLWSCRDRFRWRPGEERALREGMERNQRMFRERLLDEGQKLGYRAGAIRWLLDLDAVGFKLTPKNLKQARRIANLCEPDERKELIMGLRNRGRR